MEDKRKWKWGVNRWIILGLIILSVVGTSIAQPVQPHITAAAEKLIKEPLFTLPVIGDFYLTNTLTATILGDLVMLLIALAVRRAVSSGSLVPGGVSGAMEMLVEALYNLTESSAGKWARQIFPWFATIMILVLVTNLIKMIPGFETIGVLEPYEGGHPISDIGANWAVLQAGHPAAGAEGFILAPFLRGLSTDLNFTVALALISVFMTQVIGVRAQGPRYFTKFINFTTMFTKPFFGFIDFAVGLLELISEIAKLLSFSFRLFGVMFAGMVLVVVVGTLVPWFAPSLVYMFELFMGAIQAFVFGMLTMVFMAMATHGHGGEEEHAA